VPELSPAELAVLELPLVEDRVVLELPLVARTVAELALVEYAAVDAVVIDDDPIAVEETSAPVQTYSTTSETALPSPKKSTPDFRTQLKAKPGKGLQVEPPRLRNVFAAPKHSVESAVSQRPAEAQLGPVSSRV
jgi:hypothetical protein